MFSFIEEHHMLKPGDRVVAGISGGADSLCLLFVLLEWARRTPLSLAVVHINHGIRQEAGLDARYVENLCRQQGIPFYLTEADVQNRARQDKCSEEEAGRSVRYEAFYRAAGEFGAEKIAVAHNSNDRSETMLFHLFRGSGLKGLCSILPVRDGIIRPLLCLERQEIEAYLREKGISWCTDCTNEEDAYTRNRIRHHILPYAEREIASGCVAHMAQTADLLWETENYLEEQTKKAIKDSVFFEDNNAVRAEILLPAFRGLHVVIQKRILLYVLKALSPSQKDIAYAHIRALLALLAGGGNGQLNLPFGIEARKEYDKVLFERRILGRPPVGSGGQKSTDEGKAEEIPRVSIDLNGLWKESLKISLGNWAEAEFSVFSFEKGKEVPENECTKWFDYDKIEKSPIMVRSRQTGDYLTIADGRGGLMHKSLKDFMITSKIPRMQRDSIPVLAAEHHVVWLVGRRSSEYYKISGNTKRILQVQLRRGCESSEMEEDYGREY